MILVDTVEPGQIIAPPPDGASCLGFIFARASSPAEAESALLIAHRRLHFDIRPEFRRPSAHRREAMTLIQQDLELDAAEVVAPDPDEEVFAPKSALPSLDSSGYPGRTAA